jgi:hypothetical protein
MEVVAWVLLGILGIVGAIAVHVTANDLHQSMPSFAVKLIGIAAKRLPADLAARYREEWLAIIHAIECLICARNLRKIQSRLSLRVTIGNQSIHLAPATALLLVHAITESYKMNPQENSEGRKEVAAVLQRLFDLYGSKLHRIDISNLETLVEAMKRQPESAITIDVPGKQAGQVVKPLLVVAFGSDGFPKRLDPDRGTP